ncbi:MAG: hypothetical protein P8182_12095, partial [Deltaproteobacteria bacterium]
MIKGKSVRRAPTTTTETPSKIAYDYLKEIIKVAKRNGWDLNSLQLVPKDLPPNPDAPLTRREFQHLNQSVRAVLKRFSQALTPPVPPDLEKSIRRRQPETWLPWEVEAIEKIDNWRGKIRRIRPR